MKHLVLQKDGEYIALRVTPKTKKDVPALLKTGYTPVSLCDSKEKAEGMIMGLKANAIVEKYAGHLPLEVKVAFKTEIAQLATNMYNEIVK